MSDRPAETVAKLADYLWWLLPTFLKKKDRLSACDAQAGSESLAARFCDIWGEMLDESRTTLTEIIPQLLVETATGAYLDKLARQRQVFRADGEDDESLRTRVLAAHLIKRKGGTIPGMENGLTALGFDVVVWEYRVVDKDLMEPPADPDERDIYIVSAPVEGTWDDWEAGDEPLLLDEGELDDFAEPTGAFAGHANDLAMWKDVAWIFLRPMDDQVVKNQAENQPLGTLYCFDGFSWQPYSGHSQWSHFVVQVRGWDGEQPQTIFDKAVRDLKPAHTRAVIVSELEHAGWDDWETGDSPLPLDIDNLDDFLPSI